uniref:Uncharacterized protein n=1 Tax=Lotharella oceanica TaxID=641309 RepID=A0A7S2XEL4_9EUKA
MIEVHAMLQKVQAEQEQYGADNSSESFGPNSPIAPRARKSIDGRRTSTSNASRGSLTERNSQEERYSRVAILETKAQPSRNSLTSRIQLTDLSEAGVTVDHERNSYNSAVSVRQQGPHRGHENETAASSVYPFGTDAINEV